MKKIFFLSLFLISPVFAETTTSIYNPFTGKFDYITVIAPNITPSSTYSGFTFDGINYCLYVNGVQKVCYSQNPVSNFLLTESTGFVLAEGSGKVATEK